MGVITLLHEYVEGIEFALKDTDFTIDEFRLLEPDDFMYRDGYIVLKNFKHNTEVNASWRTVLNSSFPAGHHAIELVSQLHYRATGNRLTVIFDKVDWLVAYPDINPDKYLKCVDSSGKELIRNKEQDYKSACVDIPLADVF